MNNNSLIQVQVKDYVESPSIRSQRKLISKKIQPFMKAYGLKPEFFEVKGKSVVFKINNSTNLSNLNKTMFSAIPAKKQLPQRKDHPKRLETVKRTVVSLEDFQVLPLTTKYANLFQEIQNRKLSQVQSEYQDQASRIFKQSSDDQQDGSQHQRLNSLKQSIFELEKVKQIKIDELQNLQERIESVKMMEKNNNSQLVIKTNRNLNKRQIRFKAATSIQAQVKRWIAQKRYIEWKNRKQEKLRKIIIIQKWWQKQLKFIKKKDKFEIGHNDKKVKQIDDHLFIIISNYSYKLKRIRILLIERKGKHKQDFRLYLNINNCQSILNEEINKDTYEFNILIDLITNQIINIIHIENNQIKLDLDKQNIIYINRLLLQIEIQISYILGNKYQVAVYKQESSNIENQELQVSQDKQLDHNQSKINDNDENYQQDIEDISKTQLINQHSNDIQVQPQQEENDGSQYEKIQQEENYQNQNEQIQQEDKFENQNIQIQLEENFENQKEQIQLEENYDKFNEQIQLNENFNHQNTQLQQEENFANQIKHVQQEDNCENQNQQIQQEQNSQNQYEQNQVEENYDNQKNQIQLEENCDNQNTQIQQEETIQNKNEQIQQEQNCDKFNELVQLDENYDNQNTQIQLEQKYDNQNTQIHQKENCDNENENEQIQQVQNKELEVECYKIQQIFKDTDFNNNEPDTNQGVQESMDNQHFVVEESEQIDQDAFINKKEEISYQNDQYQSQNNSIIQDHQEKDQEQEQDIQQVKIETNNNQQIDEEQLQLEDRNQENQQQGIQESVVSEKQQDQESNIQIEIFIDQEVQKDTSQKDEQIEQNLFIQKIEEPQNQTNNDVSQEILKKEDNNTLIEIEIFEPIQKDDEVDQNYLSIQEPIENNQPSDCQDNKVDVQLIKNTDTNQFDTPIQTQQIVDQLDSSTKNNLVDNKNSNDLEKQSLTESVELKKQVDNYYQGSSSQVDEQDEIQKIQNFEQEDRNDQEFQTIKFQFSTGFLNSQGEFFTSQLFNVPYKEQDSLEYSPENSQDTLPIYITTLIVDEIQIEVYQLNLKLIFKDKNNLLVECIFNMPKTFQSSLDFTNKNLYVYIMENHIRCLQVDYVIKIQKFVKRLRFVKSALFYLNQDLILISLYKSCHMMQILIYKNDKLEEQILMRKLSKQCKIGLQKYFLSISPQLVFCQGQYEETILCILEKLGCKN